MLGLFPFIAISGGAFAASMTAGFSKSLKAYSQSAGYAEQALTAIRVVSANGREETEVKTYDTFLDRVRKAGMAVHINSAISFGFLWFIMFAGYGYTLYIGSWFI